MGLLEDTTTETLRTQSGDSPPTYAQTLGQPPTAPPLNLAHNAGPASHTTITHYECIAHLKFLAALSDLRDTVTSSSNLFDISDPNPREFGAHINEAWALTKEKRWAVYTSKAVERYTTWWRECVPTTRSQPTTELLASEEYDKITACDSPLSWTPDELPPLDILMVWHAHMLNPRAFLEDCIRQGKMSFWATGFPWEAINACIDDQALTYDAGKSAANVFAWKTNLQWNSLEDMPCKLVDCPNCGYKNPAPWTDGRLTLRLDQAFDHWTGFADKNFRIYCAECELRITHDTLRFQKFRADVEGLLNEDIPMPGTYLNVWGFPEHQSSTRRRHQQATFPNRLIRAAKRDFVDFFKSTLWTFPSIPMLRDHLEVFLQDREVMREANPNGMGVSLQKDEKIAVRRMMSRYWDNSSQFALDLVGAVVRQGTFVQKMDNIDWLHSPAVLETTLRLTRKYAIFFSIMSSNPGRMAVPTLDVDLAWHTHQLAPSRYFEYSMHRTSQDGRRATFIDHDDKVAEVKLSDGFEWTSKMYRKLTDGGIYSECTCWYCEATRGSDLQRRSSIILPTSSGTKARSAAAKLHDNPDISSDPDKNPHISAHSAVKTKSDVPAAKVSGMDANEVKFLKLRSEYERTRRRADKRSSRDGIRRSDDGTDAKNGGNANAYAAYPLVWGVPVYVPFYAPYSGDPGVHSDAYAADPSCMNLHQGHSGNCAAGTCGGAVAAGSCGGMGGGCTGGCAGGCGSAGGSTGGGGGGGNCGGGGGGCGGGGGGGGCGGGGGGGGC